MYKQIQLALFFFCFWNWAQAQQDIKLIKATDLRVGIKDGDQPITRWWEYLQTTVKPVVYHVAKINQERKVVFYTNLDSISFDVKPGNTYDFKVLLNGKDTCYARISTVIPSYYKECSNCRTESDTIPFTLGIDHYIHIKGKVNNSEELDFIFDTGAGTTLLNEKGRKKAAITLDGISDGEFASGTAVDSTSSSNHLQLGGLHWYKLPLLYVDYQGSINTDGVLGYNIVEDKVVEIDYDKSLLILHARLPSKAAGYARQRVKHDLNGTFFQATINTGKSEFTGWYLFDTGGSLTVAVGGDYAKANHIYGTMEPLGKSTGTGDGKGFFQNEIVELPFLNISGFQLSDVPIHIAGSDKSYYGEAGIIGNNVLKRFNAFIDYPNATVYLKPNGLMNTTYQKKNGKSAALRIGLSVLVCLIGFFFFFCKKRKLKLKSI